MTTEYGVFAAYPAEVPHTRAASNSIISLPLHLGLSDEEIEVVACMLLGARHYLCMRYTRRNGRPTPLPKSVIDAYMKVVTAGFIAPKKARRKKT